MNIVDRFLKYVSFETTSDENTGTTPSTTGQMVFAQYLAEELRTIGLTEVSLDNNGYIMATLPANTEGKPTIGFIAHMDTAPDASGKDVKTSIVKAEERDFIDARYAGQEVIVTRYSRNRFCHGIPHRAPRDQTRHSTRGIHS